MGHIIDTYEPEYCAQCGEILSTDGFCMRCDGIQLDDEEPEELPTANNLSEELNFDNDPEPQYEPDTIANGKERDTASDGGDGDLQDDLSSLLRGLDQ